MRFLDWLVQNNHITKRFAYRLGFDSILHNKKVGDELALYLPNKTVHILLQQWINEE